MHTYGKIRDREMQCFIAREIIAKAELHSRIDEEEKAVEAYEEVIRLYSAESVGVLGSLVLEAREKINGIKANRKKYYGMRRAVRREYDPSAQKTGELV